MVDIAQARLGVDLLIQHATDDVRISSGNDFKIIQYQDNLSQAVISRVKTLRGELELHPDYGSRLPLLVGQVPNDFTLQLARQHVREALLQEPRIKSIDSIKVSYVNVLKDTMQVDIMVTPIDSEQTLNIIFPYFITGESA